MPRWTREQYEAYNSRRKTRDQTSRADDQHVVEDDVAATPPGEKENPTRFAVVITSYRTRLADVDALVGKFVVDALRYCGLLASDQVGGLDYQIRQEKVPHVSDERTEVTVTPL